jgi:hypothetical protein
MRSKWITHKGKRIFHIDLSGLGRNGEAFRKELLEAEAVTCQQPEDSLLVLTDTRDTVVSSEVMSIAKEGSARTTKYVRKTAVIGVTGVRQVLLDAVSRFSGQQFATFDDIETAKDWLVSDD